MILADYHTHSKYSADGREEPETLCLTAINKGLSELSVITDFNLAIKVAKNLAKPGENVLFSPATSSFDLFNNYEERGDKFIEIVNAFK